MQSEEKLAARAAKFGALKATPNMPHNMKKAIRAARFGLPQKHEVATAAKKPNDNTNKKPRGGPKKKQQQSGKKKQQLSGKKDKKIPRKKQVSQKNGPPKQKKNPPKQLKTSRPAHQLKTNPPQLKKETPQKKNSRDLSPEQKAEIDERIANATAQEEIDAIMKEFGITEEEEGADVKMEEA